MSRYNLLEGGGGGYINPGRRLCDTFLREGKEEEEEEEWNANSPAVARSGRPMSDRYEAFEKW